MKYNIRLVRDNEETILDSLFARLIKNDKCYDLNIKDNLTMSGFFSKRVKDEDSIIFVAVVEDEIVGYIYGYVQNDNKIKIELEAYIDSLFVDEEYRKQGIGNNLINKFIEEAKYRGVKYIYVENKVDNEIARFLYEKLDFNIFIENRRKEI